MNLRLNLTRLETRLGLGLIGVETQNGLGLTRLKTQLGLRLTGVETRLGPACENLRLGFRSDNSLLGLDPEDLTPALTTVK